jgi:hemolysin III
MRCSRPHERMPSPGEEIANAVSHGIGLSAALVAAAPLLIAAIRPGSALNIIGCSVFVGTMVLLYLVSTLYHALPEGEAKRLLRVLDHVAIFLSVSTFFPFAVSMFKSPVRKDP